MGIINDKINSMGYNAREKAYIYGGAIMGAAAPVIAARYLLFNHPSAWTSNPIATEVLAWGFSILTNLSSMVVPLHLPVPVYTGAGGMFIGTFVASGSQRKRFEKRVEKTTLEDITKTYNQTTSC